MLASACQPAKIYWPPRGPAARGWPRRKVAVMTRPNPARQEDRSPAGRRAGQWRGRPMSISRRPRTLAACAVAAATAASLALAACSASSSGGGSVSSTSGGFGSVPAASGTPQAGTITWAEPPGTAPTWILPIVPGADFTVYSTNSFSYESWRPLYWTQSGVSPTINPALSLADTPTYSNGDKTVTIRLKTNYKWSDGQPVTSKDALFYIDEVRAAVKESGANWGSYSPGIGIPDQVTGASTP